MARTKQRARKTGSSKAEQTEYDETVALRDPALLADTISQAIRRHYKDSTDLERDAINLPSRVFRDATAFGKPRVAKELPDFLQTFFQADEEDPTTCKEVAAPHTLVIASSGIRVSDLVRELRVFTTKDSAVGKYFSKHMKLRANIEFAKKTKVGIAVGTPVRLQELITNEAINVDAVQRILIDGSYQNEKKISIFDSADSLKPMLDLLNLGIVKSRLLDENDKLQILVF